MRERLVGFWVCLCVLVNAPQHSYSAVVRLEPGDAAGFVSAVTQWGATGEDTTIVLAPGSMLSLANATFPAATGSPGFTPFSAGTLSVLGDDSFPPIIDTGARAAVLPSTLTGSARVYMANIILVNMCDQLLVIRPSASPNSGFRIPQVNISTAFLVPWLVGVQAERQRTANLTIYGRHADVAGYAHFVHAQNTPFPKLQAVFKLLLGEVPNLAPGEMTCTAFSCSTSTSSLMSVANPLDPILNSMRAAGTYIAPRYCQGLGPPGQAALLNDPGIPSWLASDTQSLLSALSECTQALAANMAMFRATSAIFFSGMASPYRYRPRYNITTLRSAMLFIGQGTGPLLNQLQEATTSQPPLDLESDLDMEQFTTPLMPIATNGELYIVRMRLHGLGTRTGFLATESYPSAFPLAAFPLAAGAGPIQAYAITLSLPSQDYLALLNLVSRNSTDKAVGACINATVWAHATALQAGITNLVPSRVAPDYSYLVLSAFSGWGLNAVNLVLEPEDPELPLTLWNCTNARSASTPPSQASSGGCDKKLSTTEIGIIAGCSVVGLLLLVAAVLAFLLVVMRRKKCCGFGSESDGEVASPLSSQLFGRKISNASTSRGGKAAPQTRKNPIGLPGPNSRSSDRVGMENKQARAPVPIPFLGLDAAMLTTSEMDVIYTGTHGVSTDNGSRNSAMVGMRSTDAGTAAAAAAAAAAARDKAGDPGSKDSRASVLQVVSAAEAALSMRSALPVSSTQPASSNTSGAVPPSHVIAHGISQPSTSMAPIESTTMPVKAASLPVTGAAQHMTMAGPMTSGDTKSSVSGSSVSHNADPRAAVSQLVDEMAKDAKSSDTVVVEGVLGSGSWGTVYRGHWRGLQVALKTLVFEVDERRSSARSNSSTVGAALQSIASAGASSSQPKAGVTREERAILEAAVAATVDHRNVVRTYHYDVKAINDSSEAGSGLQITMAEREGCRTYKMFLVQELCAVSLDSALHAGMLHDRDNKRLLEPIDAVIVLLLDIAYGLEYLHSRNIIHGDLKPANVLLKTDETAPYGVVAKLTDFGLSARMGADATHVSNFQGGTPYYVAPEVVHDKRTSTASDVFSFGVVMWQTYSNQLPFQTVASGGYTWNPVFPNFQKPNIPNREYMSLMQKCLLRDSRQRPVTRELIMRLQNLMRK